MVRNYKNSSFLTASGKYRVPKTFGAPLKKMKRSFRISGFVWKMIIGVIIILALSYFFFLSSFFRINEILVEGNQQVDKEEISVVLPTGQNIFLFNMKKYEDILLHKFPEIKQVQMYKGIPNALKIVVLERDSKFVWQSGDKRYLISSQGEVGKEIVGTEENDLPLVVDLRNLAVTPGSTLVSPNFVAFILNIYSTFYEVENIRPQNFEVGETTFDVNLKTEAGFFVKLNTLRSSKKQLDNLKKVLVEKRADIHEYVDLRIDGWAYYK